MSTPKLVAAFYERIWNKGDLNAAAELLARDFSFRGSGMRCAAAKNLRGMSVLYAVLLRITVVRFFRVFQKATKRLPRCAFRAVTSRCFVVTSLPARTSNGSEQRGSGSKNQ
jgi:hypothetical protein